MAASLQEVNEWIAIGKKKGATHVISVCDTFDWDDYPVYVMPDQDVVEREAHYRNSSMQKINEVIEL